MVECLYPLFVILCSLIYLGEPMRPTLLPAVGLLGTSIVVGTIEPSRSSPCGRPAHFALAVALSGLSLLLMALAIVMAKPVLNHTDCWWAARVRMIAGTAYLAVHIAVIGQTAAVARALRPARWW